MDIRKFNCMVDGYLLRREESMNDMQLIGHRIAGKIAQAVWGSRDFQKALDEIELVKKEETAESRNRKVLNALIAKGIV